MLLALEIAFEGRWLVAARATLSEGRQNLGLSQVEIARAVVVFSALINELELGTAV